MILKNSVKVAICIIFLLISYSGYKYYKSSEPTEIPIIEPESGAIKVKPVDAGGIILPHSDSIIYENMSKGQSFKKINILPEPEQALPILGQKSAASGADDSIDSMLASLISPGESPTEILKEDLIAESIFEEMPSDAEPQEKSLQPESKTSDAADTKSLNVVKVMTNSNKRIGGVKNLSGSQKSNYKIQLGSMKSESLAITEGERIKRKHAKILGNSTITQKKVQQEKGKFFYVILAGDYPTLSKAKATCKKLAARQQSCMIYQP